MARVLFVCTGNTCRSPMAEAILASKNIEGLEVRSAGIFALPGADASPQTIEVLNENDISFSHQAKQFSEMDVDWADFILTMTNDHKQWILQHYPQSSTKVYTVKEFANEYGDVMDPFGGPVEIYRKTFQELHEIIKKIEKKLNEN